MTAPVPPGRGAASVWAKPVSLSLLMGAGLILALIGDGPWDGLACILLASALGYAIVAARAGAA